MNNAIVGNSFEAITHEIQVTKKEKKNKKYEGIDRPTLNVLIIL